MMYIGRDRMVVFTTTYAQRRLNSIIGLRAKQCTGAHSHKTTRRNKTVNADKIKHTFIVLVLPTKSVFKH